jgi:hypothetical protein
MAQVTLEIPEELSAALAAPGRDLSRTVVEALALEAYRERKLSTAQLRRLLGFESRYHFGGFLKAHKVWLDHGVEDLERDREAHWKLEPSRQPKGIVQFFRESPLVGVDLDLERE